MTLIHLLRRKTRTTIPTPRHFALANGLDCAFVPNINDQNKIHLLVPEDDDLSVWEEAGVTTPTPRHKRPCAACHVRASVCTVEYTNGRRVAQCIDCYQLSGLELLQRGEQ